MAYEPSCQVPADDRERLLRLLTRLNELNIPNFQSPALKAHAELIKKSIELLKDETIKIGQAEFRKPRC